MHSLKTIFKLLNYKQKKAVFYLGVMIVIGACLELLGISLILPIIDILQNPDSNIYKNFISDSNKFFGKFFENQNFIFLALFIVYLIKNIFLGFLTWLQFRWSANIQIFFSKKLFLTYLTRPYLFHKKKNSSELFRNLEEVDMLGRSISSGLAFITEIALILGIFILLIVIQPMAAIFSLITFGLMSLIILYFTKNRLVKYGEDRQNYLNERVRSIRESFGFAIKEIKLNQSEDEFLEIYNNHNTNYAKVGLKASTVQELPKYFFEQFALLVIMMLIVILNFLGNSNTEVVSILGLFVFATFRILPSIKKIMHSYQYISYGQAAINLIQSEISDDRNLKKVFNSNTKKIDEIDFKENIKFKNVNFFYDNESNITLENLNFEIEKNKTIGIFGKSGSGKSTLVDLFSGLIIPTKGQILLDNKIDISQNYNLWQKKIGYVSQNIFLLDDTIKNNILFSKKNLHVDIELMENILEKTGLKNFIKNLPNGLNTIIGELGAKISGGEIQRIGIARVLYKKPEILIFDESTNALDAENELKVFQTIKNLKNKCTILLITHKKNNLAICDEVLEIDNKKIKKIII